VKEIQPEQGGPHSNQRHTVQLHPPEKGGGGSKYSLLNFHTKVTKATKLRRGDTGCGSPKVMEVAERTKQHKYSSLVSKKGVQGKKKGSFLPLSRVGEGEGREQVGRTRGGGGFSQSLQDIF